MSDAEREPPAADPFFSLAGAPQWNAYVGRQADENNYVDGFVEAAQELVALVIDGPRPGQRDTLVMPILYSARHGVELMRGKVPGARLFCWVDRPVPFAEGRVHAKIALADADCAFITSANLTGYALERNIEAGVLVRGTQLPSDLHEHLNALIAEKVLRPVEAG